MIEEGEMRGCHPISTVPDGRVEYAESLRVSLDSTFEDASGNATVVIIDNDGIVKCQVIPHRLCFICMAFLQEQM